MEARRKGNWVAAFCAALCLLTTFAAGARAESPDHGNSISTATAVNVNSSTAGTINSAGDYDYFRISVPSSGTLTVYTTGSTDTYGYLKNSSGTDLASNDDSSDANFRIVRAMTAGTYYIAVRHYNASAGTGAYTFSSSFSASASSDDHGNSISTATAVNVNSSTAGTINSAGDYDYFRISVPSSGTLTVYTTGSTDTYGYLKNSSGTDLASNDDESASNNFRIVRTVTAGTYYVAVRHYSSTGTGAYTLYASVAAAVQPAPTLLLPANGSTNVSAVTFQWNPSPGATNYRIVMSQNSSFSGFNETSMICDGTCSTATTTGTQHTRSSFTLSGHTYYWRVRANGPSGASRWSNTWQFTSTVLSQLTAANLNFPCDGNGWSNSSGAAGHSIGGGYQNMDDRYALDLNLNTPSFNLDDGKYVYPIAPGNIVTRSQSLGFVLIQHTRPLRLDDGTVLNNWYSGYMHMENITASPTANVSTSVGQISRSLATNDHLHFAIYSGNHVNGYNTLTSINTRTKLQAFAAKITYWY